MLVGIWRGVQIDANYVAGEFTWNVSSDGSVTIEKPDATKTMGKITEAIDNKFWGWGGPSGGFPGVCQYHFSDEGEITICIKKFYDASVKKFNEDKWNGEFDYGKFI